VAVLQVLKSYWSRHAQTIHGAGRKGGIAAAVLTDSQGAFVNDDCIVVLLRSSEFYIGDEMMIDEMHFFIGTRASGATRLGSAAL